MSELAISQQFLQFTEFASDAIRNGDTKAIARKGVDSGIPGVAEITSTTDDKVYAIRRSQANKTANNTTRTMFKKAVAEIFGGESKIPDSVLAAMNMKDFDKGKPLTARRIMAVKNAVDKERGKMRQAGLWLAKALTSYRPGTLSAEQKQQAKRIIAKYGNSLRKAGENVRGYIIDKLINIVADPKLGPHAEDLFALIPWDLKSLTTFTLDDVREQAPQRLLE